MVLSPKNLKPGHGPALYLCNRMCGFLLISRNVCTSRRLSRSEGESLREVQNHFSSSNLETLRSCLFVRHKQLCYSVQQETKTKRKTVVRFNQTDKPVTRNSNRTKRRTSSDEDDPLSSKSSLLESVWAWEKNWGELNFLSVTDQRRCKFHAYYILHKDFNNFVRKKKEPEKLLSAFSLVLHCLRFWQDMDEQSIVQSHIWKCYVLKAKTLQTFVRDKDKKWNQFQS